MTQTLKGLYYCRINSQDPVNKGAVQKCHGLIKGFKMLGWDMGIVWLSKNGILMNEKLFFPFPLSNDSESWRNIFFNHLLFDWMISRKIDFSLYSLFFVRYPLAHPGFIRLLKHAKKSNPSLRIILEIPTYPYNLEHNSLLRSLQQWLDSVSRNYLKQYVDLIVHYGGFPSLFGIPSIGIQNGVDVASIPVSRAMPIKGVIRLIAVGNWNFWHGLDRILAGLSDYFNRGNGKIKIELTIVGEGREVANYKAFVKENGIENVVRFIPPMDGPRLDCHFDQADICIGCLGIFRKKVELDSSLKHRHYCARGMPFILATTDLDFPMKLPWVYYVEEDESPVSMDSLIQFHAELNELPDLRLEIRRYAEDNLDWSKKLGEIPALNS